LFKFLQNANTQANTLVLHTYNLDKAIKIIVAKTKQETFSQTIVSLSEVIYIEEIKINNFERFKIVK